MKKYIDLSRSSLFPLPFPLCHSQLVFPTSSLADQPPDHVSPQGDIAEPSTEPKSNIRKRRWNHIVAILKDLWQQHKRDTRLRKRPSVISPKKDIPLPSTLAEPKFNVVAVIKDAWEHHKREMPLRKRPGVRQSVIAIIKTSCEHPTADTLHTH
jgi:hypothetical protein